MNVVEIEKAVSRLAAELLDANEFPWEFLAAFGNNETTIKRLRSGQSNVPDVTGGVLQRNNVHLAVAPDGEVTAQRDGATVPRWRRKTRCWAQHLPATMRDARPARPIAQAGPGAPPPQAARCTEHQGGSVDARGSTGHWASSTAWR